MKNDIEEILPFTVIRLAIEYVEEFLGHDRVNWIKRLNGQQGESDVVYTHKTLDEKIVIALRKIHEC